MSLKDKEKVNGIKSMLVLEMIGRPAEHLTETMEKIIQEMEKEKGVMILSKDIKEPIELKDNKEFFSTFAEIEVEVEDILYLAILMFKYMPAHIEIIEPELIALTNNGWNDVFNELVRRLHGYDEVARVLHFQNSELNKKIQELMPKENAEDKREELEETKKSGKKKDKKKN